MRAPVENVMPPRAAHSCKSVHLGLTVWREITEPFGMRHPSLIVMAGADGPSTTCSAGEHDGVNGGHAPAMTLSTGPASSVAFMSPEARSAAMARCGTQATNVCLLLAIFTIWLATRPYVGVIHDSIFYTAQALSELSPSRFVDDLHFRYGSPDQYTMFTVIYKVALTYFGISKSAMLLTICFQFAWICGLIYLADGIFRNFQLALLSVALAVALPGGIFLDYGEQFLTPRLVAEGMTFWSMGLMLRNRQMLAFSLLCVSAVIHPIMTLAGLAVLFVHEAGKRSRWAALPAVALMVVLALAYSGVQPFARLGQTFDPAWLAVVRVRDYYALLSQWTLSEWLQTCDVIVLTLLALRLSTPNERPFLLAVVIVAIGGLGVTLVGGDLLHNVLVVDAQQYRATWVLAVVANLFIGPGFLRIRAKVPFSPAGLVLMIALGMLIVLRFIGPSFIGAPLVAFAALVFVWQRLRRQQFPRGFGAVIIATAISICACTVWVGYSTFMVPLGLTLDRLLIVTRGIVLTAAALAAMIPLVGSRKNIRCLYPRLSAVILTTLLVVAAYGWDQRTQWTIFVETANAAPESLASLLPEQAPVYWEGDVRVPWFVLKRASYFSCAQGTGAMFFRGTAINYKHRYESFGRIPVLDIGMGTLCPSSPDMATTSLTRENLTSVCRSEPGLGALILLQPAQDAPGRVWVAPATFEGFRRVGKEWQRVATDTFYVYSCGSLR